MLERSVDETLEQLGRIFPAGPFLDRRLGRALAFQALYEMDQGHHIPAQVLERLAAGFAEAAAPPYPGDVLRAATNYAQELVRGMLANRSAIDGLIQERAPLWPLAQMSAVDRNVLRIGLYESLYGSATVPLRTAINEAVELAKLFGSETSAKFVNGVLGRAVEASISAELPRTPPAQASTPIPPADDATLPATPAGS
ncbi:MAG TPA: transcription antitermination factor NusB [Chloroflexota bacterium]|nr:transcription antitermination factor NusB [Chloroflexota bacterium]